MTGDLEELRGGGWSRLLAKARKSMESSGGALGRSIGLDAPADSERRLVIGITGQSRPETARRLTVGLADLDAALRQRHGSGLRDTLEALGGPLLSMLFLALASSRDQPSPRSSSRSPDMSPR